MPTPPSTSVRTVGRTVAAAAIALFVVAGCDTSSSAPSPVPGTTAPRQVTVVGEGKVDGTPDTLTIGLSIAATAPDAIGASNLASSRIAAVTDAIAGQGVDRKDVATTSVTLQPQYGQDGTTIVGYQSSNSVDVKVRRVDTGPQVLGAITTAGGDATRIDSVTYSIEDDSQYVRDARQRAFDDARNRAQQYAQLSGLSLGKVLSISETGSGAPPPTPLPRVDARAAAVPLSPGQQTVGFSVTVVWELT
ncbi:hypothetical protein MMAD_49190 [Mycolicibacterium madagascariense]|uniref:SIMPL domain-containing protein n=1 Tax=Mycolicibacterium madagascariense TaxID=212765 RepID=A0A7I7XN47_9MYCO|nr:SIMPL domain-containing protein [Mycolicibacterium madagascariense]MCV7013739.1 SIMPL domain-containing protein [Mycolicibacterium madagascariense]BBZ30624.1 hypothetical protein MMAD_49190 [Mycolicibacterium madagascariense]